MAITKVTTEVISGSAVTTPKIADNAITAAKIPDGTIATGHIADNAVTAAKIPDNVLTATMLPDNVILATHIPNATNLTLGTVTAALTGNVTGNTSGTALTVTQAAQTAITSVGTLSALTVSGTSTLGVVDASSFTDIITNQIYTASGSLDIDTSLSGRDITFTQGSTNLMTIKGDASGVGIGTTAPSGLLDVVKLGGDNPMYMDVYSTNQGHVNTLAFRHSKQNTVGNTHTITGTTIGRLEWYGNTGSAFTRAAHIGVVQGSSTETDGDMTIQAGGDIILTPSGKVGIGTTSPAQQLTMSGAGGHKLKMQTTNDANYKFEIENNYSSSDTINFYAVSDVNWLKYKSNDTSVNFPAGKVLIGTAEAATIGKAIVMSMVFG